LLDFLIYAIATVTVLWHLLYAYVGPMPRGQHANIHLGFLLVVFYLVEIEREPSGPREYLKNAMSILFAVAIAVISLFVHLNYFRWLNEARSMLLYTDLDVIVGALAIIITLHATWRAFGFVLAGLIAFVMVYGYAGELFPSILYHSGFTIERLIFMNSISLSGVYGFVLGVGATWVAIFLFFAGIVEAHGGLDDIIAISRRLGEKLESGFVQMAVVASMMMGSIVGSSAANVATSGSFTIPMMKRNGVPPRFAGAVESIASTAGQILPPVMASAAFLMADLLGISFLEVIRAAALPAALFYTTLVFTVVLLVSKHGWSAAEIPDVEQAEISSNITDRGLLKTPLYVLTWILPVGVILYTLVVFRFSPLAAGFWAIIVLLGMTFIRDISQHGLSVAGVVASLGNTVEGMKLGVVNMAPLTAVLAALGIVIQIIGRSGFTQRFSLQIISIAGGVFLIIVFLVMLSSVFFGLGMPTPAAYIVVALLAAPSMINLGVSELNAHMFVLYFAVLSTITPPVAVSCAVAANIADADFLEVAYETIRIGLYAFIIPYAFLFNPELIYWEGLYTAGVFLVVMVGLWGLSIGLVGHNLDSPIAFPKRILYFLVGAATMFVPMLNIKILLAAALVTAFAYNKQKGEAISLSLPTS
jgi:TRAP transporter 4TM/12TM fusion protein